MNAFLISRDLGYGSLSLRITSREGKKKQRQRRKQRIEFSPVSHSNPTPHPILRAHNKANVIEFRGDDRHTLPFNRSVSIYERTPAKKKKRKNIRDTRVRETGKFERREGDIPSSSVEILESREDWSRGEFGNVP